MTIQQLEQEYQQAVAEAITLKSRGVDEDTMNRARARVASTTTRLHTARNNAAMMTEFSRLSAGMVDDGIGGTSPAAQFVTPFDKWRRENPYRRDASWGSPAFEIHAATLTGGAASGGAVVVPDYRSTIVPIPLPPPTVAALLSDGTTNSSSVSYPSEKTFTNAAAMVAEGGAKPESTLVFEQKTDKVEKIAHWIPVTEEILEDAPALRSYIDARLGLGVQLVENDQLLNGNGVSPNLLGILARPGLHPDLSRGTASSADAIAAQIAAITADTGMVPTGIVIHPTNWLPIALAKDSTGQYVGGGGPFAAPGTPTLWGLPVAITKAITVGTALIVTRSAAMVLRRSPLTLAATNSHQDFFTKNLVALRAEQRETLAVMVPAAFGTVSGLN